MTAHMQSPSTRKALLCLITCLAVLFGVSCSKGKEDKVEPTPIVDEGPAPTARTLSDEAEKAAGLSKEETPMAPSTESAPAFKLTSSAFSEGATIPAKYTDDGDDVSPPLAWSEPPAGTQSFALIADDPDAPRGTWVHWVAYGIPAATRELPEGVPATETLSMGARQGTNDFDKLGYGGPAPPAGKPHRYYFKLYALDADPGLDPGQTKADVLKAIEGHVLGEAQLMGTYGR